MNRLIAYVLSLSYILTALSQDLDNSSIVRIFSTKPEGEKISAGFFIGRDGSVLTSYHGIYKAKKILLNFGRQAFVESKVVAVSPQHDLALIKPIGTFNNLSVFELSSDSSILVFGTDFQIVGHPYSIANQIFSAKMTQNGYMRSTRLRNEKAEKLFGTSIQIIPLTTTAYRGLSGGPLLFNNKAYGVFVASLHEGTGYSWAIPTFYVDQLKYVNKSPEAIDWSESKYKFNLYDERFVKSLLSGITYNPFVREKIYSFNEDLEDARREFDEFESLLNSALGTSRQIVSKVHSRIESEDYTLPGISQDLRSLVIDLNKMASRIDRISFILQSHIDNIKEMQAQVKMGNLTIKEIKYLDDLANDMTSSFDTLSRSFRVSQLMFDEGNKQIDEALVHLQRGRSYNSLEDTKEGFQLMYSGYNTISTGISILLTSGFNRYFVNSFGQLGKGLEFIIIQND